MTLKKEIQTTKHLDATNEQIIIKQIFIPSSRRQSPLF